MDLFTYWQPDPVGQMLGTGFYRFDTATGISGLARKRGTCLDILAVNAEQEGRGQLRNFIAAAKARFKAVSVWEVWNPVLDGALERYGFERDTITETDGEVNNGWTWPMAQNAKL